LQRLDKRYAMAKKPKRWIKKALKKHKKGALHRQLGIPLNQKIPMSVLEKASHARGVKGKRARLAKTLRALHK
jgi:hypothetical protein